MTLPDSRDFTLAASDPVPSTLLNNLQDQHVGDKHIARPHVLSAAAFQLKTGGTATLGDGQWTIGGASVLVCDITKIIPVGHRLKTVAWAYNRGGAGNITRRVRKREITVPGAAADLAGPGYPIVDNTGAAHEVNTDTLNLNAGVNEGVWLEIQFDNVAHVFVGAVLSFDKL